MKLDGIRVIDLSQFLPGPHLTMMMADHGAEVIKVENAGEGEPTRHIGPRKAGQTIYFRNTQRGKQSLRLNLKSGSLLPQSVWQAVPPQYLLLRKHH